MHSFAFWKAYPYFLPCITVASLIMCIFVLSMLGFKEVSERPGCSIETLTKSHTIDLEAAVTAFQGETSRDNALPGVC